MRERVSMYGGEFTAGPLPMGGFELTAMLPAAAPLDVKGDLGNEGADEPTTRRRTTSAGWQT
jgi:hypothetical protein